MTARRVPSDDEMTTVGGPITAATYARLAALDVSWWSDPIAAMCLNLAARLDENAGLATAGIAKQLAALLAQLEPDGDTADDVVDELRAPVEHPSKP